MAARDPDSNIRSARNGGDYHGGMARFSAAQGEPSVLFLLILFPGSPGKEETDRRTDDAKPCQSRRVILREQPTGKNDIEDRSDKKDIPRNLALLVQRSIGLRGHSISPMRPVRSYDVRSEPGSPAAYRGIFDGDLSTILPGIVIQIQVVSSRWFAPFIQARFDAIPYETLSVIILAGRSIPSMTESLQRTHPVCPASGRWSGLEM